MADNSSRVEEQRDAQTSAALQQVLRDACKRIQEGLDSGQVRIDPAKLRRDVGLADQ